MFLTARHLAALKREEGVEPWTFEQNQFEAVYIPAGCPHQVSYSLLIHSSLYGWCVRQQSLQDINSKINYYTVPVRRLPVCPCRVMLNANQQFSPQGFHAACVCVCVCVCVRDRETEKL
jgi:hypothetical protein